VPLQKSQVKAYLDSLKLEIKLRKEEVPQEVSTLFIGGGTPTALAEEDLKAFLACLNEGFDFSQARELSMEGNPGTLTAEKLHILKEHGINRISLGAQSFSDDLLKKIGRIHTAQEIREGVQLVREAGFKNLNLDLMFGLPGQSLAEWQKTLEEALQRRPEHLSLYGLMLEEDTPLALQYESGDGLPDDDLQAEMYDLAGRMLVTEGYRHYETSNFALPGYECKHNLGYWRGEEYLGLGPGAVSCIKNRRWKNDENIKEYEHKLAHGELPLDPEEDELLTDHEKKLERIILGLRLADGVNLEDFQKEFGQSLEKLYPEVLERYLKADIFIIEDKSLKMKSDYWFVANSVLQEFV
jgi:oxygen-independent coproporphyrinogen-3 oxidase